MKKLITMLSALTITSSILPLTVACKLFRKTSSSRPDEKTDVDKIKDAIAIFQSMKEEVELANVDRELL